jgi:alcohol dehydrogenase
VESTGDIAALQADVRAWTTGRGADLVFDLTGSPEAMEAGFELLRPGGQFVLAGAVYPARPLSISAEQIVRRMIRITGVYNYAPEDLGSALTFLESAVSLYPFDELVGRTFPLDSIQEAFEFAEYQRPPRVAIRMDGNFIQEEQS